MSVATSQLLPDSRDQLSNEINTRLAAAGNDPSGTPLSQVAVPTACP